MRTYTFIIGSMDDFEGIEDLMDYVEQQGPDWQRGRLNYTCHEFEAPESCDEETVTLIGRGIAFSNDWSMDGTYSFLVHGALETESEKDMFARGVEAREAMKSTPRGVDTLHPANDPVNW